MHINQHKAWVKTQLLFRMVLISMYFISRNQRRRMAYLQDSKSGIQVLLYRGFESLSLRQMINENKHLQRLWQVLFFLLWSLQSGNLATSLKDAAS